MEINEVTSLTREGDIAVLAIDSPPVNALSLAVRKGIIDALKHAQDDAAVKAVVLLCEGRTFIAGADITEFGAAPASPNLYDMQDALLAATKPVVAAVHGSALGGGFETALTCHYRIASPSASFGFPEVHLGLIPGAGGTQRLPRLVGIEKSFQLITSGAPFNAKQALEMGVIDELTGENSLRADAVAFANKIVQDGGPLRKIDDIDDKVVSARGKPEILETLLKDADRKIRAAYTTDYVMRALDAAANLPVAEGLALEHQMFFELMTSEQSAALRHVFFAERQVWKVPGLSADTPARAIGTVGVIGAGTMGGGIAMNFLNAGIPVKIVETNQPALDRGVETIRRNYENTVKKGRLSQEKAEARMALLSPSLQLEDLGDVDLIIEAVFENMDIKKEVFGKLDAIAKPGAILATNTSFLDVDEIAAATSRPQDVLGLHFFSPANVMKLLEIVRGKETDPANVATAMALAKRIGKIGVLVGVCFGFVGNRMLAQQLREMKGLILEGAMPWDVDRVHLEFGFAMGPFSVADLAGLDLGWSRETSTGSTIQEILCEMDRRGQKTGAGYYDYDENRRPQPSPVVEELILDFAAKNGIARRTISDEEILERCVYPMINEGAKILEEGIAIRASDIDVVWANGYGFPRSRGGPMHYADTVGLDHIVARLESYQAKLGEDFQPAPLLKKLATQSKAFNA
ncbi:3-hydroxyacyl-CoA dehydrogenase NAD-binding domain-containing protein [Sulfitobacter sp. EhC04]|uniref:3-hydroxyacyl-CoA dehydrogenase NAD-binding domain-containing protein n=1 Tax=Sulfitobacter sp. EhC04 TaxID=1849168 RepID=UPI000A487FB5|nr:3-hydroxyacyl-CoA dehydrogenase NAD-binding domain-containing protein [Sulfitobacter sp. EhC04]